MSRVAAGRSGSSTHALVVLPGGPQPNGAMRCSSALTFESCAIALSALALVAMCGCEAREQKPKVASFNFATAAGAQRPDLDVARSSKPGTMESVDGSFAVVMKAR